MINPQEEKTEHKIELLRRREEEDSVKLLATKYKIPYLDLTIFPVETDALRIITEDKARFGELAVLQAAGANLKVGVRNPSREETLATLKRLEEDRYRVSLFLVSKHGLERAWGLYKQAAEKAILETGVIQISNEKIESLTKEVTSVSEIRDRISKTFFVKTTEALEIILGGSIAVDASDVHIEPRKTDVRIRFRLDGVLQDVIDIPPKAYSLLLSRIKLISELKLNVHNKAQDGRFTMKTASTEIEVRTSVLPGPDGENIVLRVLNPKILQVPFEALGIQPWVVAILEHELKKPNGMILTTGPTGSGKTTTLYAFLRKIHSPSIKIITLEDPIEYHLTGIEQTQVNQAAGYDFGTGLRSILRQDPDVILVGEIRDLETAETAMHAALTGHLVFSTLHTNNAAGTIPRLLDLGVKPAIISPAINISMAQRLVRKLCLACRAPSRLPKTRLEEIAKSLEKLPKEVPKPKAGEWSVYEAGKGGCPACNSTGYKGMTGLFEIILIDEAIEHLILKDPSEFEIKKAASGQGQITMEQDGLLKVLSGATDFAELERVLGI